MTISAHQAHWGEAAYYLSLDLAQPLLALMIDEAHLGSAQRDVVRRAILANRETFARTSRPIELRHAILEGLRAKDQMEAIRGFVDDDLVTHARPCPPAFDPILNVYMFERLNERLSEQSRRKGEEGNIRIALDRLTDVEAYDAFLDALSAADVTIAGGTLSAWDEDIIRRNSGALQAVDPMENLVSTFDFRQKLRALQRYATSIGKEALDERRVEARRLARS